MRKVYNTQVVFEIAVDMAKEARARRKVTSAYVTALMFSLLNIRCSKKSAFV